jgi:peroxiredoxin
MKSVKWVFIIIICLILSAYSIHAGERTPSKGEAFPHITLPVPEKSSEKDYLGVEGKGAFKVSQIKADLIILEIFSMYCPYCQKEAPSVNELYQIITRRADIKDKVKIIGIGAGNTPFEVDVFRTQYNIQFPLFSDESFTVHKAVGEVRTPHFFVMKNNADGSGKLVYSKVGSIQDPGQFLDMILKEADLQ